MWSWPFLGIRHGVRVIEMIKEIVVVTGPESCGKTTLARQLADRWEAPLVNEAARDYLKNKDSVYIAIRNQIY